MRELIDCHIHSDKCGHATGTVAQMVSAGVFMGLTGMVFTEHLPLPDDLDPDRHLSMRPTALPEYANEVRTMAERVHGLTLVLGAEADWLPGREDEMAAVMRAAREVGCKVFLGSVHFLDGWAFDDPHELAEWERRDVDEVWRTYFDHWCDAARSGLYDVMAHPDLPKKFGHRPSFEARELYSQAAAAAAEGRVIIEVSTAGLRKPVAELYPGFELLSAFRRTGVDACVGSDAHAPGEVGYGLNDAYTALTAAGYERAAFPLGNGELLWIDL